MYISGIFSIDVNMYIFVLGEWFSVGYKGFTGCRKMVGVLVFLANSVLFHYFGQENHTFLIYSCPNVYICVQMCIFMANLIKFSDIGAVSCGVCVQLTLCDSVQA